MTPISWTGGIPRVEVRRESRFGWWIVYGPQILGFRLTRWGAERFARKARRRVAKRNRTAAS